MASEYGFIVQRGSPSSILGNATRAGVLPNIKNMIFYPLRRGLLHIFFPVFLLVKSCAMASYLDVYMSCLLT